MKPLFVIAWPDGARFEAYPPNKYRFIESPETLAKLLVMVWSDQLTAHNMNRLLDVMRERTAAKVMAAFSLSAS